jgi:hypothetical protein
VAADYRQPDPRVAGGDVVVGVAQPGGHDLDANLVRLGVVELKVGDLPAGVVRLRDGGAGGDLHDSVSFLQAG